MSVASEKQYGGLDVFRIIAAILVIAIHTSPLLSYSELADFTLTRILGRVAVPFFFMCTGFFLLSRLGQDHHKNNDILKRFLYKVGKLYLFSIILYIPINVYAGYFTDFSLISLTKDILFNGTLYHLWYFPGIMLGVFISSFLYTRFSVKITFLVTVFLYIIGLFGDSYFGFAQMNVYTEGFYHSLFNLFDYTRNGIFFAPVFVVMGGMLAKFKHEKQNLVSYAIGLLLSLGLLVAEALLLHANHMQLHDSMYIFLLPVMYFLFQVLLCLKGQSMEHLRKLSLYVYVIHPMCIVIIRGVGKLTGQTPLFVENSLIHFILVTALSFALSEIVLILVQRYKGDRSIQTGRAWAEINLQHLKHNVNEFKRVLPSNSGIIAVVKAQAYGHGGWQIAKYLSKQGIDHFAVATLEEGIELRKKGVKGEILILGYTHESMVSKLARYRLTQTVVDAEYASKLNDSQRKIDVQIKIDTGMGRLGESYKNMENLTAMYQYKNLRVSGTFTHLSKVDSLETTDVEDTKRQIARFDEIIQQLKAKGIDPKKLHVQSSYGVLNYSELNYDYARLGIALYGILSREGEVRTAIDLRPVLSLKARVVQVKHVDQGNTVGYGRHYIADQDRKIAIISIGYADGIPRLLSQANGNCLINGKRAPIIGAICMDQLMADISNIEDVKQGDIATFIGEDQSECISANELASQCKTITNELLSRLGERVEKVYVNDR